MMKNMELVAAHQYKTRLIDDIANAKTRVVIMAMGMTWGRGTEALFKSLLTAQRQGVQVRLVYDRYSWLPFAFHKFLPHPQVFAAVRHMQNYTRLLTEAGGLVTVVGKGWSPNPFARRMHAKVTIVDDIVYTFGGVNFTGDSFGYSDYMWSAVDPKLAQTLNELVLRVEKEPTFEDVIIPLAEGSTLLFDGGTPGKSIIYERACTLATHAVKVHYVSQMCPSGRLATALKDKSECYFNTPSQTSGMSKIGIMLDQRSHKVINAYRRQAYIHAKFMLFEMPDGTKILLSGSNNFSWRGVAFGTKEIAIESTNPEMWNALYTYMREEVK